MAKKTTKVEGKQPAGLLEAPTAEDRIEEFAEDLGRFLGATQAKATAWLDQRKALVERLTEVRDLAANYINQLGGGTGTAGERKPGRPRKQQFTPPAEAVAAPKKRTMSPEARERIAAAQRARWAKQKRAARG